MVALVCTQQKRTLELDLLFLKQREKPVVSLLTALHVHLTYIDIWSRAQ
jgi:hypothetical protein